MAAPWFDDLTLQLDEDFDDLEDIQSDKFWNVQLKPANSDEDLGDLKCKILIVALGNSPYLFANRFLGPKFGDWKTVAHIRLSKDTPQMASWETSAVKRTEATLWRASDDVIIVGCRHEVLPEAANRWCEAVSCCSPMLIALLMWIRSNYNCSACTMVLWLAVALF